MAQIKTVTTTSGTNSIKFDAHYPYVWFKNIGLADVYVSDNSQAQAGADDTALLKAGEIIRITAQTDTVYVVGATTVEVHAQGFADCPFKVRSKGGGITVEPLSVTGNGTYTAPSGKAYSPVTVDVQKQPWQPLEDGYSNFWFELTDDTLSPWLNFSAKNNDAVIDWGDGSGEVALDTLTPTHTYAKAGRYVVKVKGVTGIAQMRKGSAEMLSKDMSILKAAELNSEVTTLADRAFQYQAGLEHISFTANLRTIGAYAFEQCSLLRTIPTMNANTEIGNAAFRWMLSLETIIFPSNITNIYANTCYQSVTLKSATIPATLTSIGASVFQNCYTLATIHMLPTTPPTIGASVFANLPSDFIIYVPAGTAETYKAAAGWSTYADHIIEEGQTLSKAALRRIQASEKTTDESEVR